MEPIAICFASNEKYAPHCAAVIQSILDFSSENINFFILHTDLTKSTQKKLLKTANTSHSCLKFISEELTTFKDFYVPENGYFTKENFYRLKIPEIFAAQKKIIYLDCDLIVTSDIKNLWETDLGENYFAIVKNNFAKEHLERLKKDTGIKGNFDYYNSGVMVFNCQKWRNENLFEKLYPFAEKHADKLELVDQDLLNCVVNKNVLYLDERWNKQFSPPLKQPLNLSQIETEIKENRFFILHFITRHKPWIALKHEYVELYFYYLKKTEFKSYYKNLIRAKNTKLALIKFKRFINAKILDFYTKNKKTYLWGDSLFLSDILANSKIKINNIKGIIDINPEKQGSLKHGLKILPPSVLNSQENVQIISAVIKKCDMKTLINKELEKHGIQNIKIIDNIFLNPND